MEQKFYSTVEAADKAGITGAPTGVGKTFRRLAAKLGLVPTKEKGALCWTEADIAEVKANYKPRAKRTATVETPAISANNNETDGSENIIVAPNGEDVTTAQVGEPTNAPVVEETATVETVDVPPANTGNTIDMTLYNTFMLWAEKISNGQHDAVYPFVTKLKEVFAFDADKEEIIDAIKTDDLNGARRYLAQIDFVVKDDAGYLHKLTATHGDEYVLGDMPADVIHENVLAYVTPAPATNDAEDSGKTITPAATTTTDALSSPAADQSIASEGKTEQNNHADDTTNRGVTQQFSNLPAEIILLPRWLSTRKDKPKAPVAKAWSLPENQKPFAEVEGIKGFVAATEANGGLLFVDFDHCINPGTGEFINNCAANWFNRIQQGKFFAELSTSKTGAHMWALPTAGDSAKTTGKIYLTEDKKSFIEVFYGTNKFCLPTGALFRCQPNAPIATGEEADKILQELRAALADQKAKEPPKQQSFAPRIYEPLSDNPEYDQWRAQRMLDVIDPARLSYEDWFAVNTACKTVGLSYSIVDNFNRRDSADRYNERENLAKWNEPANADFNIETLHGIAKRFGYSEKDSVREWHNLRGDRKSTDKPAPMKTKQDADNFVRTQDRIKSCPVNLRLPDDFIFGEDGIEYVIRGKKGDKYISVALTPIVPTKVFRNPINNATDYEFAILVVDGWCKVEIPGTALGDRELVRMLNGRGAIIDSPQYLNKFINAVIKLNADILPRPKSYNQTGWTSEDFNDFAFPANGKSVVRREGYDYERILKPRGDREAWKEKFGEVVAQGGAIAKTIIGFACAAFLVRPLGLPNLQLHVHGRRSIGKTPAEQFAVSPFGDPTIHGLSYSFASTPKARLEMATAFRDFPMICEELESIGKREAEKIPQDVYQFFMGTCGQALKKDGTKRESKNFSGARLTSGEHSLVQSFGNAGEFKRVLELRCNTLLDEEFASDLYEFCAKNHGLFLEDWTRYIIEHQGQISKDYHQLLKYICADQKDNGTERDRTQLATLVIASVAYQYFKVAIGLQHEFDCREFEEVTNTVAAEMQSAEELDDTTRALSFLKSFVAGSDKYFVRTYTDSVTKTKEEIAQYAVDCYGKIFDSGDIAFLPHALKKILEEHGGFVSAEKLINEFKAKDYLRGNDGETTYPCRIRGKLVRTVRFKAAVFGIEDTDTDITRGGTCYGSRNKA